MSQSTLGDALFTKTQQQVLGLIYGNPERSFYLNEIVRLTAMGKGAVSRELSKLADAGIIRGTAIGNQRHYQANDKTPIFTELRGIVTKTFGVAAVVSAALVPVMQTVEQAFIYGSVAKGVDHSGSDIDLLLVGHKLVYAEVMAALTEAEQKLARTINPTLLTPREFEERLAAKQSFVTRVMAQPKLWIKQSKN